MSQDLLVALEVAKAMGWEVCGHEPHTYLVVNATDRDPGWVTTGDGMVTVIEGMREMGYEYAGEHTPGGKAWVGFGPNERAGDPVIYGGIAPDLPIATAYAAHLALTSRPQG